MAAQNQRLQQHLQETTSSFREALQLVESLMGGAAPAPQPCLFSGQALQCSACSLLCHVHVHHAKTVPCNPVPASSLRVTLLCQATLGNNWKWFWMILPGTNVYPLSFIAPVACSNWQAQGVSNFLELNEIYCAAEDILDDVNDQKDGDEPSAAAVAPNDDPRLGSLQQSGAGRGTNGAVASEAESSASRLDESAAAKSR